MPFALRTRTPLLPAALAFVSFGFVLVRVRVRCHTILKALTLLPFLANRARMAMDSMQPLHGRPSAASVEAGMVSMEATEPVEAADVGVNDDALLEAVDAQETVGEIVAAHDDEIEKI